MRITIPEIQSILGQNAEMKNALNFITCLLDYKINYLVKFHQKNNIDDIDGYGLQLSSKIVKMLRTQLTVCEQENDYCIANSINRMLADSIACFKLIYCQHDYDEKSYRHYLYILDGASNRYNLLPKSITNNGKLSNTEFQSLDAQIKSARNSDERVIEHCQLFLNKHPYSIKYPEFHKVSITGHNWRYRKLGDNKKCRQNQLSYKELYSLLDDRDDICVFYSAHLSQFVHGLSMSNIFLEKSELDFYPIESFTFSLAGILYNELLTLYPNNAEINEGFFKSPYFNELISNFSKDKIDELIRKTNNNGHLK